MGRVNDMVTLAEIQAAAERIRPFVVRTPLEWSPALSALSGVDAWLKFECFQSTGSFKLRGALAALQGLRDKEKEKGVITASAGNHGLGIARAAKLLGITATVVVPETASQAKVEALQASGVELLQRGETYDDAEAVAIERSKERELTYISAYNHPGVVAGAGTIALEILEDLPSANTLLVPAGGGGLIGGIAVATHAIKPEASVLGVQSVASPALHAALEAGSAVQVDVRPSLADGLAGNVEPTSLTLDLLRQHVKEVLLVHEDEIAQAMRWLLEHEHVLVEGSAAVGVAALHKQPRNQDIRGPVVIVLTGRNVAASVLRQYVLAS
jgi:threonine dehydratase